jgi:hypothetical protein
MPTAPVHLMSVKKMNRMNHIKTLWQQASSWWTMLSRPGKRRVQYLYKESQSIEQQQRAIHKWQLQYT